MLYADYISTNLGKFELGQWLKPMVKRPNREKELGIISTGPHFGPNIRYNLTWKGNRLTKFFYIKVKSVSRQILIT